MLAGPYDPTIEQGATFHREVTFCNPIPGTDPPQPDLTSPLNLTGYQARAMARRRYSDASPLISLTSSPAAGLTITPLAGLIEFDLTAAQTAALSFDVAVWDLEIYGPGDVPVVRLLEGKVLLRQEATR